MFFFFFFFFFSEKKNFYLNKIIKEKQSFPKEINKQKKKRSRIQKFLSKTEN